MRERDFGDFTALLDAACSLLSRGAYQPSPANAALWFRSLAAHDLAAVRAGFDAHIKDPKHGRFVPTPADILGHIEGLHGSDGRPGVEEAWAIAIAAFDEAATVVWTAETAAAWVIARPVMSAGDDVGARMAFREVYERLVREARRRMEPCTWQETIGHDPERRHAALESAAKAGRLPHSALPAPAGGGLAGLLGYPGTTKAPPSARAALLALRRALAAGHEADASGADRARTAELKRHAAALVALAADLKPHEPREGTSCKPN
jgi:hypothetical protein